MSDLLTHAEQTARLIVESRYPDCDAALLAGSFVRGQATATSDLDLIVFRESVPASYRESFTFDEYPVEAFIHSSTTIRDFFRQDRERGRPSMQRMVAEGLVLRNHDLLKPLKAVCGIRAARRSTGAVTCRNGSCALLSDRFAR